MRRILYVLWSIIFVCTFMIVLCGKVKPLGRLFMDTSVFYGDLYNECKLQDFKQPINLLEEDHEILPGQAQILCYGDSFFYTTLDSESFARVLEKNMDQKVFNTPRRAITSSSGSPLIYLENINFTKGERKIMLVESIERYSLVYSSLYLKTGNFAGKNYLKQTVKLVFNNKDIEYFFHQNIFVLPFFQMIKNLKYRLLDEVDPKIWPVFKDPHNRLLLPSSDNGLSKVPGMLFLREATEFNNKIKEKSEIEKLCLNVQELSQVLYDLYNITLIYIIIPNKYSLYGDIVHNNFCYDNYISQVCQNLIEKQVNTIDVYSLYKAYKDECNAKLLYYPNDTHYTPRGKELLARAVTGKIKQIIETW